MSVPVITPAQMAIAQANVDAIFRAARTIHSYELACRMFKDLDLMELHHENAMEYLYCEVVSPDDGRKYVVRIYPPKD